MRSITRVAKDAFASSRFRTLTSQTLVGKPLLQPGSTEGTIQLNETCGVDVFAEGVPTVALIGPSRRGKSVLSSLLAGGDPGTFQQSHSSFQAMTSGTHICEVPATSPGTLPLRVIDTEGLSHIGRSRTKEAMVRQFLISTYLTSSCLVWLDTEVLSTSFFTVMWLVYDYVVDVLKVRDAAGPRLPRMMYIRTQETDVQRREYEGKFQDFAAFFTNVMEGHEDAQLLRQMFAPGGLNGHSLPVWTTQDLEAYEGGTFWTEAHQSPFKDSVRLLQTRLVAPLVAPVGGNPQEDEASAVEGPPLLALGSLEQHLSRIAKLEAFDPRDHESTKVSRLRAHLRASYGRPVEDAAKEAVRLADIFDPADRPVRAHGGRIDNVARARLEEQCRLQRLEMDVALEDREVTSWLESFGRAQSVFAAAVAAFAREDQTQTHVLRDCIERWQLNPETTSKALAEALAAAEEQFLAATALSRTSLKQLGMRERLSWRLDECVLRLRGRVASELLLQDKAEARTKATVWRLGKWEGPAPQDGKSRRAKAQDYALWTDGRAWALYTERWDAKVTDDGAWIGILQAEGTLDPAAGSLPIPEPKR